MPRIINAYDGNSALGDSLAKLGESIYGDQAKNEVYRQKAFGSKRENDNIPLLADAVASGDRDAIARYGVMSNKTGQDAADFNRLAVSNHANGLDDPRMALATMGAGGAFTSTAPGQGRALANDRSIAGGHDATTLKAEDMRSKRAADTQLAIDGRTVIPVDDGNGGFRYDTKTNAVGQGAPMSSDQVIANMLRRQAAAQQPGAPTSDPLGNMDPRLLKKAGFDLPEQSLVHPGTNQTAISRDGGRTAILPDGRQVPATGFQPVGQDAALSEARGNVQRAAASQPLVVQNPAASQAAADASRTSGLGPALGTDLNHTIGAIPGAPSVFQGAFGSPQIAPGVQDARQTQDIRNNQARAVLLGAPGRQTTQAQRWVNELLPQGDAFANPATEAAKIPKIVSALQGDHEQLRQVVLTTADPVERAKASQSMHAIENTIRMYTDPAPQPTAPPAAAPQVAAAAPQAAAPTAGAPAQAGPTQTATGPGGKKLGLINGQWVPM